MFCIASVCRAAGWVPGVIGTTGLWIDGAAEPLARTTPEAPDLHRVLARMREDLVRVVAMEISSHALAQHRTDGLVADVALFTNLSQDHLDFHPSMEAYFEAKRRLFAPTHAQREPGSRAGLIVAVVVGAGAVVVGFLPQLVIDAANVIADAWGTGVSG